MQKRLRPKFNIPPSSQQVEEKFAYLDGVQIAFILKKQSHKRLWTSFSFSQCNCIDLPDLHTPFAPWRRQSRQYGVHATKCLGVIRSHDQFPIPSRVIKSKIHRIILTLQDKQSERNEGIKGHRSVLQQVCSYYKCMHTNKRIATAEFWVFGGRAVPLLAW